jgi:energy-coupling factor transport system ATP-binding protein
VAGHAPARDLLREVTACEAAGLRPLPLPDLFARVGRAQRPLTREEARQAVAGETWTVDETAWQELQAADAARQAAHGEPLVVVSGLGHRYEGHWALRGVDLTVRRGEFVALLGPNGAGKTTLARHLNGLLRPTEGRVEVAGLDTARADVPELSRAVGYLFQDPDDQIFASKVEDEVAFGLRNRGVPEGEIASRVAEALEWMGLANEAAADPFTLTRGQRQQVALASILALRPDIIVFDEPTTGLDGQEQEQMMARLQELNRAGHTIIMITHATWAAVGYADRVVLLQDGEVLADGPPREVFAAADLLSRAHQVAPEVVQFSREVSGRVMLSVAEAAACLRPGGGGQ